MEPALAFSLACGVIQVVDFSSKVLSQCREIYKGGSLSDNNNLDDLAQHLISLRTGLKPSDSLQSIKSSSGLSDHEIALTKVSKECFDTADLLVAKLRTLKLEGGSPRKRDALRKTFRAIWMKSDIDDIQKRIDRYQKVLDTQILVGLRNHLNAFENHLTESASKLDSKTQILVSELMKRQASFDELKVMINTREASTQQHITRIFHQQQQIGADKAYRDKLLHSLYFPEINTRQEEIRDAHAKTLQWIFDETGDSIRPWHSFVHWLENGQGTYWISGKAGSGKSTLMSYICEDSRTESCLNVWSGAETQIIIPKFFFWAGGCELQKTSSGLLRSIIHQILEMCPDIIDVIAQTNDGSGLSSALHHSGPLPLWTERRLQAILKWIIDDRLSQRHICLFVDGLDELTGDQDNLLQIIQSLICNSNIKVCLSSRPDLEFEAVFGSSAMLKLQDLTKSDIQTYVSDKLNVLPQMQFLEAERPYWIAYTSRRIVHLANGVFLWVRLAVKDQIRGFKNGDSLGQLEERLELLPTEIEALYLHILNGIDVVYKAEAVRFFQMALGPSYRMSVLDFALMESKALDEIFLPSSRFPVHKLLHDCRTIETRIPATCAGLLEVHQISEEDEDDKDDDYDDYGDYDDCENYDEYDHYNEDNVFLENAPQEILELEQTYGRSRIGFHHRSAIDFLQKSGEGKEFMKGHPSRVDPNILYVKVVLAKFVLFNPQNPSFSWAKMRVAIFKLLKYARRVRGATQSIVMDCVDHMVTDLCSRNQSLSLEPHWSLHLVMPQKYKPWTPRTFYADFNVDNSASKSIKRPIQLVGLAVALGLYSYVQQVLFGVQDLEIRAANYLVGCALMNFPYEFLYETNSNEIKTIVLLLLRLGADPNVATRGQTVWEINLLAMEETFDLHLDDSTVQSWATIIRAFLDHHADVNRLIDLYHYGDMLGFPRNYEVHTEHQIPETMDFELRYSALAIIEGFFTKTTGFDEIIGLFYEKGARVIKIVHRVRICFKNTETVYNLSEEQSDSWVTLYETLRRRRSDWIEERPSKDECDSKTIELCEELSKNGMVVDEIIH